MRILHVPHAYWPVHGGAERLCRGLSEELANRGHQVRVLTANIASPEAYYRFGVPRVGPARQTLHGVEVVRVAFQGGAYQAGQAVSRLPIGRSREGLSRRLLESARGRFCRLLQGEIEAFAPDVVMTLPHLLVNVRCVLRAHHAMGFPLVVAPLMHEDDPYWPEAELREALAGVEGVVASTSHEAERLRTAYRVPPERVFTAGMAAELPPPLRQERRRPWVLSLGRKAPSKDLGHLLAAMRLVWEDDPGIQLVLAGARVPMTGQVDELLATLPPDERRRVISLDDVSEEEKGELLRVAACLALPSKIESFGIVLLEAWAHGMPVVALDLPVLRSTVETGKDGLLVEPDDPDELAEAILFLVHNHQQAEAMGRAGREKVEQRYTWAKVADRYLEAYEQARAIVPSARG
ncbi:MAG: glycosyltransferase family 4 protein [Actinomycetota bacterium]|nr:glycosyltransferase family 4 protein [Actinomycetota bacterium]